MREPPAAVVAVHRWWRRRSLRTRLVTGSVLPLGLALVVGTVALTGIFAAGRLREVDAQTGVEGQVLSQLAATGQLPNPLPVPAGSTLLAQVLSSSGEVLAATAGASRLLPLDDAVRAGVTTVEHPSFGVIPLRVRALPASLSGRPVAVLVAAPLGDVRRATRALQLVLLVVVPVLVVAATVLAWLLVGLALRPVERLRASAATLVETEGSQDRLLVLPEHEDELRRLARTFNDVLARLYDTVGRQRSFVADAAHELRSPLTSIRIQLDVAGRHQGLVDSAELVAGLGPEVDRLSRLTDDLLLLARLDARQPLTTDLVDLAALAGLDQPAVLVRGDRQALERLVRNLVDNATRHAAHVQTSVRVEGPDAVLDVDDDGDGIPIKDRLRVFERWVRLDEGRASVDGGAGLGLALVAQIAAAHGGSVQVLDSPLGGARLRVRLPGDANPGPGTGPGAAR